MARVPKVAVSPSFSRLTLNIMRNTYIGKHRDCSIWLSFPTTKWSCEWIFFYINLKGWEFIGCLNMLFKNAFNYFVLSYCKNFKRIINYYSIWQWILTIQDSKTSFCCSTFPWSQEIISRYLSTIWSRAVKNFPHPQPTGDYVDSWFHQGWAVKRQKQTVLRTMFVLDHSVFCFISS
jgi:hypothetical protein